MSLSLCEDKNFLGSSTTSALINFQKRMRSRQAVCESCWKITKMEIKHSTQLKSGRGLIYLIVLFAFSFSGPFHVYFQHFRGISFSSTTSSVSVFRVTRNVLELVVLVKKIAIIFCWNTGQPISLLNKMNWTPLPRRRPLGLLNAEIGE